uniref:Uncharacterized protein n=1 Tax=Neobodo designis TaxID=312471 RepID=A0A7S1QZX8_NEODS
MERDVSTIVGGSWRWRDGLDVEASVRKRHIFAPASSKHAGAAPVRGVRADVGVVYRGAEATGVGADDCFAASEWVAEATGRVGTVGRGTSGAVFARAAFTVERELHLPRGRVALGRVRLYGFAMPLHSAQMPAVDAPQHLAGIGRGSEHIVAPPGGAAVAAASAELDCPLVPRKATLRFYASSAAALPSWKELARAADGLDLSVTIGWALVPAARQERSNFADEQHPRRMECRFPARVWLRRTDASGGAVGVGSRLSLGLPRCALLWEPADADFPRD